MQAADRVMMRLYKKAKPSWENATHVDPHYGACDHTRI